METRIVQLDQARRGGHGGHGFKAREPELGVRHQVAPPQLIPLQPWDVDIVASLTMGCACAPNRATLHWLVDIYPEHRGFDFGIYRVGWDPMLVLQARQRPQETAEQRWKREGCLWLLHQAFAASYQVLA